MPTRYLRPGVRDSEAIDKLSALAETMFYRLLVTVDDFGRADARPAMVKASCFPIKDGVTASKCAQLLDELSKAGLIQLYEAEGKTCLQMQKWDNKPRAASSMFPAPADGCIQVYADARIPRTSVPVTVTVTETETGTVDSPAAPSATAGPSALDGLNWKDLQKGRLLPLSASWELPEEWGDDVVRLGWKASEILLEAEKFRQYWVSGKGTGTRRSAVGWRQSWSNWINKAAARR